MRISIAEIVAEASAAKSKADKVAVLRSRDNPVLRQVLRMCYDPKVEILLPDTPPPWKKHTYVDVQGRLYSEAKRLRIFVRGGGYDNLTKVKRESLFIELLQSIDNDDAELLSKVLAKKPLAGLPAAVVAEAFPDLDQARLS